MSRPTDLCCRADLNSASLGCRGSLEARLIDLQTLAERRKPVAATSLPPALPTRKTCLRSPLNPAPCGPSAVLPLPPSTGNSHTVSTNDWRDWKSGWREIWTEGVEWKCRSGCSLGKC